MKTKAVIMTGLLAVFSVFALGSVSQKTLAQTQPDDSSAAGSTAMNCMGHARMMGGGMMGSGTMAGGMMGQTMMGHHNAMQELIDQLTADISAASAEAKSTVAKSKLADASSIVAQLQNEMSHSRTRMQRMTMRMQNCPATQTQQDQK